MAKYSKIVKKRKKKSVNIVPEPVQAFIARRVIDVTGTSFLLLGVGLLVALGTYNRADPSWNTASAITTEQIHNWIGIPGAYISDLLLQTLGIGSVVFGIAIAVWGVRILKRHEIPAFWMRVSALIFTALAAATALSRLPAGDWLIHPWLGGSGGTIMLDALSRLLPMVQGSHSTVAIFMGILAVAGLSYAIAISRAEWKKIFLIVAVSLKNAFLYVLHISRSAKEWVVHYGSVDSKQSRVKFRARISKKIIKRVSDANKKTEKAVRKTPRLTSDKPESKGLVSTSSEPAKKAKVVPSVSERKETIRKSQSKMSFSGTEDWELPSVDLLQNSPPENTEKQLDRAALRKNAELLQNVLADYNIQGEIVSIHPGPVVTLYELEPAPGTKTARIVSLSDDIARSMSAISVRCSLIPGRNVIGIELPNVDRQTVYMRQLLDSEDVEKSKASLPLVLGKDIGGKPIIADLASMPHLLVAGTTGSGKSVAVNSMILSLLYRLPPEKCRFIMIDPKMLELSAYDDIPHLLSPVVTEPAQAIIALKWAVQEMEDRYRSMAKLGVRNIDGYNARLREARKKGETLMRKVQTGFDSETGKPVFEEQPLDMTELPYIVIIVDEFADLVLVAKKEIENAIQRLAQMARAAGIHLIMATQRPSADVITGVIKSNFPTRISFQVTSKIDSGIILGEGGAEQLLGMGDMLYMASGGRITRVHGPFVSDEDVENVVDHLKAQAEPNFIGGFADAGVMGDGSDVMEALFGGSGSENPVDDLYDNAVALVAREGKASTSFVQRHLQIGYNRAAQIGYNRAARIIEEMEKQGVIGPANHVGKREVLVSDFSDF
jgi:S-DNA-T family DNA segregation ATPase FtsK/SpoIIIE